MKMKLLPLVTAMFFAATAGAANHEEGHCSTEVIQDSPNLLVGILSFPFKVVVALTYGPRCLIASIPKNE